MPVSPDPGPTRMRAYRRRLQAGVVYVSVPVDAEIIQCLIDGGLLAPDQEYERAEVADAISFILQRLARGLEQRCRPDAQ
jgi:hypothetical protein